jgi:thiol-disulfide isomerase/thioredoxin
MLTTNIAILLGVIGVSILVATTLKMYAFHRATEGAQTLEHHNRPTLVYFWTPNCAVCKSSQTRIVDELAGELDDDVEVIKINALDAPQQARAFGIMTVPTTVVLGPKGDVRRINTGVIDTITLREQLRVA